MIAARTWRLIRRLASTAAILAVIAVLVVIYIRSEGKGVGRIATAPPARTSGATGRTNGAGNGGSAGSANGGGASEAGSCEPPRVCGSQTSGTPASGGSSSRSATGTFRGPAVETPYGPVQVAVVEERGKLVDVKALELPIEHSLSRYISERVAPMLRSEALQAQSAEINVVSGATFTSEGFASSLQKALSEVH